MRPIPSFVAAAVLVCLGSIAPARAAAQQRPPQTPAKPAPSQPAKPKKKKPRPPIFVAVGLSGQVTGNTTTQTLSFPLNGETATVTGTTTLPNTPHFEGGFGVQVNKRFSIGGRASFAGGTGHAEATFTIPNPLVFNADRTASGSGPARRSSFDLDLEFGFGLMTGKAWRMDVIAGPTFSHLNQQLVTDSLVYVEAGYPFDTITVQPSGTSTGQSMSTVGVQVGVRVTRQFNRQTGVSLDVRWRRASFTPQVEGTDQHLVSGGLQIGGGLRFVF